MESDQAEHSPPQAPPPIPRLTTLDCDFDVETPSPSKINTDTLPLDLDIGVPLEQQESQWLEICVDILVAKITKYHTMPASSSASASDDFIKQKIEEAEKEVALERARRGLLPGQHDPELDGIVPVEEEMNDRLFIANYALRMEGSFFTPLELANVPAFLAQPGPSKSLKEMERRLDEWRPCGFATGCVMPDNPLREATRSGGERYEFGCLNKRAREMEKRVRELEVVVEGSWGDLMQRGTVRGKRGGEVMQRKEGKKVSIPAEDFWKTDEEYEDWIKQWDREQDERQARERKNKTSGKVKREAAIVSSLFTPKEGE